MTRRPNYKRWRWWVGLVAILTLYLPLMPFAALSVGLLKASEFIDWCFDSRWLPELIVRTANRIDLWQCPRGGE